MTARLAAVGRALTSVGNGVNLVVAIAAVLSALFLFGGKLKAISTVPAQLDSTRVLLREHSEQTRGVNARLDKLLCVETSPTQQEKIACLR